jgi:hypothetical protein
MAQLDAIGKLRTDQEKLDVNCLLTVRETLTAEQLAQARKIVQEHRAERREQVGNVIDRFRERRDDRSRDDRPGWGRGGAEHRRPPIDPADRPEPVPPMSRGE